MGLGIFGIIGYLLYICIMKGLYYDISEGIVKNLKEFQLKITKIKNNEQTYSSNQMGNTKSTCRSGRCHSCISTNSNSNSSLI